MIPLDLDAVEARVRARTAARDSVIFSSAPTMTVDANGTVTIDDNVTMRHIPAEPDAADADVLTLTAALRTARAALETAERERDEARADRDEWRGRSQEDRVQTTRILAERAAARSAHAELAAAVRAERELADAVAMHGMSLGAAVGAGGASDHAKSRQVTRVAALQASRAALDAALAGCV